MADEQDGRDVLDVPDGARQQIAEVLQHLGVDDSAASEGVRQILAVSEERTSGHFPPPGMLERYDQVLPGCAERIVVIAENAAASQVVEGERLADDRQTLIAQRGRGQFLAFGLTSALIIAAAVFFALGNTTAGIAFLGSDVILVIIALLGGAVELPGRNDDD